MNRELTPAQKAAHTRKWRRASQLAHQRAKNAKTFAKYVLAQKGYRVLSFDSRKGYEYVGVVDLLAVKRDRKDPDKLHVILIQVKGGSAKVTLEEIRRLRKAVDKIEVSWNVAEKPFKQVRFLNSIN
ncbi:MAG: restriction endonuclease [Bacteroidota bacterium]